MRNLVALGLLVFAALQLIVAPALVVPAGFAMAIGICGLMMYDEYVIWKEVRDFRRDYERL